MTELITQHFMYAPAALIALVGLVLCLKQARDERRDKRRYW